MQAKFECTYVGRGKWGHNLKFQAVSGTSEENAAFFKATPSGSIEINTLNDRAIEGFEPGKTYYVGFVEAVSV